MVVLNGITEGGTAIPIQVNESGEIIARGAAGPAGPEGPAGPTGPKGDPGEYGPGDDVELGSSSFAGEMNIGDIYTGEGVRFLPRGEVYIREDDAGRSVFNVSSGGTAAANSTIVFLSEGSASFAGAITTGTTPITPDPSVSGSTLYSGGQLYLSRNTPNDVALYIYKTGEAGAKVQLFNNGSATFAGGKCGFTSEGELIFTSRNTRYKLVVQDQVCLAEPYTRQMELKEKAEKFIADKRETKPITTPAPTPEPAPDSPSSHEEPNE